MRVYAVRGATTVTEDSEGEILERTAELFELCVSKNFIRSEDLISCVLTSTPDLTSCFPAKALRGWGLPLLSAQEIPVSGALPRAVRVMVHYHHTDQHSPRGVYLREAVALRPDVADPGPRVSESERLILGQLDALEREHPEQQATTSRLIRAVARAREGGGLESIEAVIARSVTREEEAELRPALNSLSFRGLIGYLKHPTGDRWFLTAKGRELLQRLRS